MKVIITGSTGMVGGGVLLECIADPSITHILLINRHHLKIDSPRIQEILHQNFTNFSPIQHQLNGYDACFHCMGVSSAGMSEEKYKELTYDVTKSLAENLIQENPNMVFTYVSGAGTYDSGKGRIMWARVKGKTENLILNIGFKDAYAFRPGLIIPEKGIKSKTKLYNFIYVLAKPIFPLLKNFNSVTTTSKLGKAMINVVSYPQQEKRLNGSEINRIATITK